MPRQIAKFALLASLVLIPAGGRAATPPSVLEGEIFTADTAHSLLDFTVRQAGFGRVRGTFKDYRAAIFYVEDDLTKSTVSVTINTKTIETGSKFRDDHLRSADFFEVEKFPTITFRSERVDKNPQGYALVGRLTIRDVSREVRIPFQVVSRKTADQFENQRIVFDGKITLNRKDFGVVGPEFWNNLISEEVEIDISLAGRIFNFKNSFARWQENSVGKAIMETVATDGAEAARQKVLDLWTNHKSEYSFGLMEPFAAGMQLYQGGQPKDAIVILSLIPELYKDSVEPAELSSVYATLSEIHAQQGDRPRAVENAEKALSLDPANPKAQELLRHLKK